jgi:hypothetical protein
MDSLQCVLTLAAFDGRSNFLSNVGGNCKCSTKGNGVNNPRGQIHFICISGHKARDMTSENCETAARQKYGQCKDHVGVRTIVTVPELDREKQQYYEKNTIIETIGLSRALAATSNVTSSDSLRWKRDDASTLKRKVARRQKEFLGMSRGDNEAKLADTKLTNLSMAVHAHPSR